MTDVAAARSLLFVPASRPDRFERAAGAGADLVVLDLEDAVAPEDKAAARDAVAAWVSERPAVVRINAAGSSEHAADLAAIAGPGLVALMLPKAECPDDVGRVSEATGVPVLALVESAAGIHRVHDLAGHPATVRLVLGAIDLAVDLGCEEVWESLLLSRSALVLASRVAGLPPPVDGVSVNLNDDVGLRADVVRASSLGFGGKLCLHPRQVPVVHDALRPTAVQLEWAAGVLAVADAVGTYEGTMVDAPVRARARAIAARAGHQDAEDPT